MYSRLNSDLDLLKENVNGVNGQSEQEKQALKEQLEKWKRDKEENKLREKEEKKKRELQAQVMLR